MLRSSTFIVIAGILSQRKGVGKMSQLRDYAYICPLFTRHVGTKYSKWLFFSIGRPDYKYSAVDCSYSSFWQRITKLSYSQKIYIHAQRLLPLNLLKCVDTKLCESFLPVNARGKVTLISFQSIIYGISNSLNKSY